MNLGFGFNVSAKFQLRLHDAKTGKIVKTLPWTNNLVTDLGLNKLAGVCVPPDAFVRLAVGSGTNAMKIPSGAVTFSQSGTSTVTASSGFFTSSMVGGILKYGSGSGGVEQYISSVTNSTTAIVFSQPGGGFPTATGSVGTVWQVQTTNMQAYLYQTSSLVTGAGNNGYSLSANTISLQRTFQFGVQSSPYTVNEIGWSNGDILGPAPVGGVSQGPSTTNNVLGRTIVSSVTVGTSNFLTVVMVLQVSYSPSAPTAVGNVNTNSSGQNTAGNAMIEYFACPYINNDGTTNYNTDGSVLCADFSGGNVAVKLSTVTFTQNSAILDQVSAPGSDIYGPYGTACSKWTAATPTTQSGGSVPQGQSNMTFSLSPTTNGETFYGICFRTGAVAISGAFTLKFTAPGTMPVGAFPVSGTLTCTYSRTLVN